MINRDNDVACARKLLSENAVEETSGSESW